MMTVHMQEMSKRLLNMQVDTIARNNVCAFVRACKLHMWIHTCVHNCLVCYAELRRQRVMNNNAPQNIHQKTPLPRVIR